jgi:TP901 family phage tail tape measure protein
MPTTEKVNVIITGQDRSKAAFSSAGKSASGLGSKIGTLAAVALPALAIGLGKKAVDAAVEFDTAMRNVGTLIDDNGDSVKQLEEGIKSMVRRVPKSPKELGAAAYQVVSAGISDMSQALIVLEASARLATAGLGTTEEATDILTSAINAFGIDAGDAESVANSFFLAVKSGKTTVAELAQGFGQVAPLANEMGVEFNELIALTSAMTTTGLKASVAYTQIKGAISNLLKPTKEMQDALDLMGVSNVKAKIEADGLVSTFQQLKDVAGENDISLAKMFGSVEGLNAVLMATGEVGENANLILEDMAGKTEALDEAVKKQNESYAAQIEMIKSEWNVLLQEAGKVILPILIAAVMALTDLFRSMSLAMDAIIGGFKIWIDWMQKAFDWIDKILNKIEAAISAIKRWREAMSLSATIGRMGDRLGFQSGGLVNAPLGQAVPAIVHGGERIIPTGRSGSGGGGGGTIVNINGGMYLSEDAAEEMGNIIIDRLKLQMRV